MPWGKCPSFPSCRPGFESRLRYVSGQRQKRPKTFQTQQLLSNGVAQSKHTSIKLILLGGLKDQKQWYIKLWPWVKLLLFVAKWTYLALVQKLGHKLRPDDETTALKVEQLWSQNKRIKGSIKCNNIMWRVDYNSAAGSNQIYLWDLSGGFIINRLKLLFLLTGSG